MWRTYAKLYFGSWVAALILAAVVFALSGWVAALVAIGLSSFVRYFLLVIWRRTRSNKRSDEQVCPVDGRSLRIARNIRVFLAVFGFIQLEAIAVMTAVFGLPIWIGISFAVWGPIAGRLILRSGYRLSQQAGA